MATIIENFNDIQLDLITSGTGDTVSYVFSESSGDFIKLTLYNSNSTDSTGYVDSFNSNGNPGFQIYRDAANNIYVKINEILDENYVVEDNYTVQFDFLRDIFSNFYNLIEGGCNSPIGDENETIASEEECSSFGECDYFGDEGVTDFITEIQCCGDDGALCQGEQPNVWTGYQWTEASYQSIEGYQGAKFYIKEISPSRKEIRLIARNANNDIINFDDEIFVKNFSDRNYGLVGGLGSLNDSLAVQYGYYKFDYLVTFEKSVHLPIVNWTFDSESLDETTIVIRLNDPVPTNITTLSDVNIQKEVLPTHQENIYYVSNVKRTVIGDSLTPDLDAWSGTDNYYDDNYQNYNQLLATASINNTDIDFIQLENNNDYKNLKIDFSDFNNHVLFGSAKSKVSNFKDKVVKIENYLNELSESLHQTGSHIRKRREDLFGKILVTKQTFTPYEKFLYYGDDSGSYSAPNIGSNLAHQVPVNMANASELNNYDGFKLVHKFMSEENASQTSIFKDKYFSQDPPFYNYSGSVYLSFLMKADEVANNNDSTPFSWVNTNNTNSKLLVPFGNFHGEIILQPTLTGSEWRRFIFESSQSYWRPTGSAMVDGEGDVTKVYDNFDNSLYWEVLNTTEKVFSASISGSTGTGYPIVLDDVYNEFGTYLTSSGNPFTGSLLPAGEYFNLYLDNNTTTAITSSFITDVKITLKNPDKALPFGEVYSTGSTEWQNWYNNLYSLATTYDEKNIHSLKNNLPTKLIEDTDYENLHTFVNMWGEQFDLIRNYIDNYSNFYKRSYSDNFSTPENLLPILADNLGWELINPFSGSLSNYYNQFSGSAASNKTITDNLWRRTLNNLIYIYKSKGTENSLNALLNCLGYPSEVLNVNEYGGVNYQSAMEHSMKLFGNSNTPNNLDGFVGNHSYQRQTVPFGFFNLEGSNVIPLDWGSSANVGGVGPDDTIEFMFLSKPTTNTQELISSHFGGSSLTSSFWDVRLLPGSTNDYGSIQLRMNTSSTPSAAGITHVVQTKELPIKDGSNFINVMLQKKDLTSPTGEYSASLSLTVGKKSVDGDGFSFFETTSSTVNNVTQLANWSSSNATRTTGNLLLGRDFTGSFAEVRVWSGSLSQSIFREHVLNPMSVVGNEILDSHNNLYYRFRLNEQIVSGSTTLTINDANPYGLKSTPTNFTKTIIVSSSLGQISQRKFVNISKFGTKNAPALQKNNRMITVGSKQEMIRDLHPKQESSITSYGFNEKQNSKRIELYKSPSDKINDYILNSVSGKDMSKYYSKWSDLFEPNYQELDSIRKNLLRGVIVDINKYIRTHVDSGIFNPLISNLLPQIFPARVDYQSGIRITPDILDRVKYEHKKHTVENQPSYDGLLKHPHHSFDDYNELLFSLSSSKYLETYNADVFKVIDDISFNQSYLDPNRNGYISMFDSSSLKDSEIIDIHKAIIDDTDVLTWSGLLNKNYGSNDVMSQSMQFTISSVYNNNQYNATLSNNTILSESAVYNQNYYTYDLSNNNILSQSALYTPSHIVNIDMINTPQLSQSAKYKPSYIDTISLNNVSHSGTHNENFYEKNLPYTELSYSSSGIFNENYLTIEIDNLLELSESGVYNKNHYNFNIDYIDNTVSMSANNYDTNQFGDNVSLGRANYNINGGVFRSGMAYKNGLSKITDMWGRGVNDLHFYDPLWFIGGSSHKISDTYNNIYRYEDRVIFELIGDIEHVSQSVNTKLGYQNITDYSDKKYFFRNQIRNVTNADKEYNYKTLYNNSDSTEPGRPVGRTNYYRDNNGVLEYPTNHYSNFPSLRDNQLRFLYDNKFSTTQIELDSSGNEFSSSRIPNFKLPNNKNAQYDVLPESQAYSVEVGGSNTSKTLTITKK